MDLEDLDDLKKYVEDYRKSHDSETSEAFLKELKAEIDRVVKESIL